MYIWVYSIFYLCNYIVFLFFVFLLLLCFFIILCPLVTALFQPDTTMWSVWQERVSSSHWRALTWLMLPCPSLGILLMLHWWDGWMVMNLSFFQSTDHSKHFTTLVTFTYLQTHLYTDGKGAKLLIRSNLNILLKDASTCNSTGCRQTDRQIGMSRGMEGFCIWGLWCDGLLKVQL